MDLNKQLGSLRGKAQDLLKQHGDKIERGVDKAERFARTKAPKQDAKIGQAAERLRGLVEKGRGDSPAKGQGAA